MEDGEKKGLVYEVASWVWGTVQGGFNEKQRTSQIIVDAVIGMIPVVGDVTATRDLIALLLHMTERPELRKSKLAWFQLVLLVFALIPITGGLVKGVGKLLIKEGSHEAKALEEIIAFLNRVGVGNAPEWLRALDVRQYEGLLVKKFTELTAILEEVCEILAKEVPQFERMVERLATLRDGLKVLGKLGVEMIPKGLKDLHTRLRLLQGHLYAGTWHEITTGGLNLTREAEARLVVAPVQSNAEWKMNGEPFPASTLEDYRSQEGWPDISRSPSRPVPSSPFPNPTSRAPAKALPDQNTYNIAPFSGRVSPVWVPPGTKLYRVVQPGSKRAGWWAYALPESGLAWRHDIAVLERWSKNGLYFELTVPPGGLHVWEGQVASQLDHEVGSATEGQFLPGGGTQLYIDFDHISNQHTLPAVNAMVERPTHWNDHLGVNVPAAQVTVQALGTFEVAPKVSSLDDAASVSAAFSRMSRIPASESSHEEGL